MSLVVVGAAVSLLCIVAFAMSNNTESAIDLHDPQIFQERKRLYRTKRDDFRKNTRAMEELKEWKTRNDDYDYVELRDGLIPSKSVGKVDDQADDSKPFTKSDTWFSEFKSHNRSGLILSESPVSYIISNLASYDKRHYPELKGEGTPEGQGFGHCLVISRERIFNVIDPEATANHSALLKGMKEHFITFWKFEDGPAKLLKRVRSTFDEHNKKLESTDGTTASCQSSPSTLERDFVKLEESFKRCEPDDFEFAFHAHPQNSVGHLHMHVFPKSGDLRQFSAKNHDWKTIPIEAVLEVEEEDEKKMIMVESGSG